MKFIKKSMLAIASIFIFLCALSSCAHNHLWSEWIIEKEATCTENGIKSRTCSCGASESFELPAAHTWDINTCGARQTCTICKAVQTNSNTHAKSYSYDKCRNCDLDRILVTIPQTSQQIKRLDNSGNVINTFEVIEINHSVNSASVTFSITGKQTYSCKPDDYCSACVIGYKLYDADGYVVASGTIETIKISLGDSIRNVEFTIGQLVDWSAYTLELTNAYKPL